MVSHPPPKLALDEDVRPLLARLLRERGIDAITTLEAGRAGAPDEGQLIWTADQGRILVTHNAADFARLAAAWQGEARPHAGIAIARQEPVGRLLRHVLQALAVRPEARMWTDQVVWLVGT